MEPNRFNLFCTLNILCYIIQESLIARILESIQGEKFLLNGPRTSEAQERVRAAGLVVRAAGSTTSKRLLADKRSGGFTVYTTSEIIPSIPQREKGKKAY